MAKKRYHQSMKDRMAESKGMERALHHTKDKFNDELKHDANGYPFGSYPYDRQKIDVERRHKEMAEAGMIHEDHSQVANLPQNVRYESYSQTGPYIPEGLDDTIRGIDAQMDEDDSQRSAHFFPRKY